MKQRLLRLDRIAGQMNAWLLVIAIGLGMLDLARISQRGKVHRDPGSEKIELH